MSTSQLELLAIMASAVAGAGLFLLAAAIRGLPPKPARTGPSPLERMVKDLFSMVGGKPKVFILRMRNVPMMDATGLHALLELQKSCSSQGITLILAGALRWAGNNRNQTGFKGAVIKLAYPRPISARAKWGLTSGLLLGSAGPVGGHRDSIQYYSPGSRNSSRDHR